MFTVIIYKASDGWFMDDAAKDVIEEPLIMGMPEIIERIVGRDIHRFTATFSDSRSSNGEQELICLEPENDGYWYKLKGTSMRGWLCPVLFQYFEEAPQHLYISWHK
jgi:hypothetical protein